MENKELITKELKSEVEVLSNIERGKLFDWAVQVRAIQNNSNLDRSQKLSALKNLNNVDAFKNTLIIMSRFLKTHWKKASWSQRLGIIGVSGGLALAGTSGGAGIAALGGAVGIPFFLLTAAGGTFIGSVIDALNKKH